MITLASTIAYTPFLDPLNLHEVWWWLLVPMALLMSIAWKAVRVSTFKHFWRPVFIMTVQIVVAMAGLAVGAYIVVDQLVPLMG